MIRIWNTSLEFLAEIDDYESFMFGRSLYTHAPFELQISAGKNNVEYLQEDNLITVGTDLKKCGIIKVVERTAIEIEIIKVTGFTLDQVFTGRLILPVSPSAFDTITGPAETALHHYIKNSVTEPIDTQRTIDLFELEADQGRGGVSEYNARFENLAEFLTAIRTQHELGLTFAFDLTAKKIKIDVLEGVDHRSGTEAPVKFSTDYDNLISQTFYQTGLEHKNVAYIGGEGEAETRTIEELGAASGLSRKELFVDTNLPDESLIEAGTTELALYPQIITFEGEVINRLPFIYGQDFELGDLVTITNKRWGVNLDTRIVEVTEIYEPSGFKLQIAFGNKIPTIKDVVQKRTKKEVR